MVVNDNAGCLNERGVLDTIAGKPVSLLHESGAFGPLFHVCIKLFS